MLRILIADDHPMIRRGLRQLLEEQNGWAVCAEASTGRTSSAVGLMPSLFMIAPRCVSTVFTLMRRSPDTALLLRPSATS